MAHHCEEIGREQINEIEGVKKSIIKFTPIDKIMERVN